MITSQYFNITSNASVFASNRHIANKQHCSVWVKSLSNVWTQIPYNDYDLVNNSIILNNTLLSTIYSQVELRVADSQEELGTPVTDISTTASIRDEVIVVADNISDITTVADNIVNLNSIADNIVKAGAVADNMNSVVIVANDLTNINIVASNKTNIDIAASNITEIQNASANASIATTKAFEASASAASAYDSSTIASNSEIKANKWADNNYNVEVETGKYSAKHWAIVSQNYVGVKVVESIAELKTLSNADANQIEVLGYYAKGDGGGGLFYWDSTSTESDNGGTIIQATGIATGRWKRPKKRIVSTKEFDSFINCISSFSGTEGTGYGKEPIVIDLNNETITLTSDVKLPINISLINGTIEGNYKLIFRNPYIDNISLRGYTEYWQYMKSINSNVNFKCITVLNIYIGAKFKDCTFNGLVFVNSNSLWTEYNEFLNCKTYENSSIGAAVLFDGNLSGTSIYSFGSGAGTSDGSFGYTSFNECLLDVTAPTVGLKIEDGATLYNGNLGFKGYTRNTDGGAIYIKNGKITHCNLNFHIETFGAAANIISMEADGSLWYNTGSILSVSPESKMLEVLGCDIRSNNIDVIGTVLLDNAGNAIYQGDTYPSKIISSLMKRDFTNYKKPTFSRTRTTTMNFNSNTVTVVSFPNSIIDTLSNTSSAGFTCSISGNYHLEALIGIDDTSSALAATIMIYKNGVEYLEGARSKNWEDPRLYVGAVIPLVAGDTIDIRVYVFDNAGSPSVIGTSVFNGFLI